MTGSYKWKLGEIEMGKDYPYVGISYFWTYGFDLVPEWLWKIVYRLWKRIMCPYHIHLLDEVYTSDDKHYLVCDSCDLEIGIAYIK